MEWRDRSILDLIFGYGVSFKESRSPTLPSHSKVLKIGQGTFGEVFKATRKIPDPSNKSCDVVAMKRVLMDHEKEGFPITALREIKILQTLNRKTNDYGSSTDSDNPIGHENWFGWVFGIFSFFLWKQKTWLYMTLGAFLVRDNRVFNGPLSRLLRLFAHTAYSLHSTLICSACSACSLWTQDRSLTSLTPT